MDNHRLYSNSGMWLAGTVAMGWQLDTVMVEVFPNRNDPVAL